MNEVEKNKDIIQPIWYIKYQSDIEKRSVRLFWEISFGIISSFFIAGLISYIFYQTFLLTYYSVGLWLLLWFGIHYLSAKYLFERDLDLDNYSMISYYCGRISIELYKLGNYPDYYSYIYSNIASLRYRLIFVIFDYRGDKSGKRKALKNLRKNLKYLPKFIKENLIDSNSLFSIGNNFLRFGEYISHDKLEDRISNDYLKELISCLPVPKKRFKITPYNIMTHKLTLFLICILSALVIYNISFYYLDLALYESIAITLMSIPAIVLIFQLLIGKLERI